MLTVIPLTLVIYLLYFWSVILRAICKALAETHHIWRRLIKYVFNLFFIASFSLFRSITERIFVYGL